MSLNGPSTPADQWRRPPPTPRQARADVVLGIVLAAAALVSFELARSLYVLFELEPFSRIEQCGWALASTLPLCVRRRFPLPVVLIVSAAFIGSQARSNLEGLLTPVALFLAIFTAGAWGRDRRAGLAVRTLVIVAMFCWLTYGLFDAAWEEELGGIDGTGLLSPILATQITTVLFNVLYFGGAVVFGTVAWRAARTRDELSRRNAELEVERTENARRAVIEERVRIAREVHDVVAHHVSVMGIQAGAARHVLDNNPEAARTALASIETSSRDAVREMRQLLGVLRDDRDSTPEHDGDRSPAPGVEALGDLVGRLDHPGLAASFVEVGEPMPLARGASVSLFRVAQEAMTNTVRHAGASRVDIRLRWLDSAVEVEVVDDGRGTGSVSGSGLGLLGMRERVALHGGVLDAGPRPTGGFRVRARVALSPAGDPA